MRRLVLGGAIAVLCTPVLAACTGDSDAATPTPTSVSTSSPTPTTPTVSTTPPPTTPTGPQPPALPPLAKQKSLAGAKAFVRFYIAAMNYGWHAESGTLLRRFSLRGCIACRGLAGSIDNIGRDGGFSHGGDWMVTSASPVPLQPLTRAIIQIGVSVQPGRWKKTADDHVRKIEPHKLYVDVHLRWLDERWLVTRMLKA